MSKLVTPFGNVKIYDNHIEIEYKVVKLDEDSNVFPDINGRYKIIVEYKNDKFPHLIYCTLEGIDSSKAEYENESGERIEFTCNGKSYFESHEANDRWYIQCEEDQTIQYFESAENLLNNAIIDGIPLDELWDNIKIQYIL